MRKTPLLGVIFSFYGLGCLALVMYLPGYELKPSQSETPAITFIPKPDFANIEDSNQRKQAFFDYLTPLIKHQNQGVLNERQRLESIQASFEAEGKFSKRSTRYIDKLTKTYRFDDEELNTEERLEKLLRRVDTIPLAMALAQAASESGWGSSRFATNANNFFGQWCYQEGCGMVPKQRPEGASHEVAKFSSVRESVNSYFLNINTHFAYKDFRTRRKELRDSGKEVESMALIPTLIQYSERGEEYLEDLYQIIRFNDLNDIEKS